MCRSPPVGNFCQLITSFVLRLCIEHTRRIINIVAILELEHEAEINVLKDKAEQGQEALQKVDQLEQIVNNLTEGGASE